MAIFAPATHLITYNMTQTTKRAVLFDLDGVLIDSEGIYTEFWAEVDRRYPTGVENFAVAIKGSTLPKIYEKYFPSAELQAKISADLRAFEDAMPLDFFPGVPEMVRRLRSQGWRTAVVTSSNPIKLNKLRSLHPEFDELFDLLITDADVTRSKPDPQGYLMAAERLGCNPADCLVVEDSIHGLHAGRAAGARVIGIATTLPRETVEPLADLTLDTAADLEG